MKHYSAIDRYTISERTNLIKRVAPRRGAWIETLISCSQKKIMARSHPAGVRGLKQLLLHGPSGAYIRSHPAGVRGLKLLGPTSAEPRYRSHPAGVRGLKPKIALTIPAHLGRTPQGCVD